jgi:Ca2+-binding EF-hand superfamily protein
MDPWNVIKMYVCMYVCRWLKEQFQKADFDRNDSLNYEECFTLLNQLNVKLPKDTVKRLFNVG